MIQGVFNKINLKELTEVLKATKKNGKATGMDGINDEL